MTDSHRKQRDARLLGRHRLLHGHPRVVGVAVCQHDADVRHAVARAVLLGEHDVTHVGDGGSGVRVAAVVVHEVDLALDVAAVRELVQVELEEGPVTVGDCPHSDLAGVSLEQIHHALDEALLLEEVVRRDAARPVHHEDQVSRPPATIPCNKQPHTLSHHCVVLI